MARLRASASVLSVLSLVIAAWLWADEAGVGVMIAVVAAAACLAVVSPFDAPDPSRRTRVLAACLAYVGAMAAAVALALGSAARPSPVPWLAALLASGLALSCWAFTTRNRRRAGGMKRYFEN